MKINFRHNQVYLLGDTHFYHKTYAIIKNQDKLKNCDIVFLGDGHEGFLGEEKDREYLSSINDVLASKNLRMFCIRGNHSDPRIWKDDSYNYSNLFFVPDYSEGQFPNKKSALLVGGGISIDRLDRKQGIDYWKEETTPWQLPYKTFDFLFSHDAPEYFNHSTYTLETSHHAIYCKLDAKLIEDSLAQRAVMSAIAKQSKSKFCVSGHFHNDIIEEKDGVYYRCLNIYQVDLFDATNPIKFYE